MLAKETLDFLKRLSKNNDREWFQENKKLYNAAQDNLMALTGYLIGEIAKFDDKVATVDPKSCVFRIYRDVRFAKDKSPYKTNIGAYISPGGRKSMEPGYYLHIESGHSFIAGGKYMPDGPELLKIRTAIAKDTIGFKNIVEKKSYLDTFGEMRGDRLKKAPKGFDPEHAAIEYLKLKGFTSFAEMPDNKVVISPQFPAQLVKNIKEMYPLIVFLRSALK